MSWSQVVATCIASGGPAHVRTAAANSGLDVRTIVRRATREAWPAAPFPGVLLPPGQALDGWTWAAAAIAYASRGGFDAVLAARDAPGTDPAAEPVGPSGPTSGPVALTRSSALAHLGLLRSYPSRVELTVAPSRGIRPTRRLSLVRSALLTPACIRTHDRLPVLTGASLLRDLAPVREREVLRSLAIDLAQDGWVHLDGLPDWLRRTPVFPGKARLREVVADLTGAGRTDSTFEYQVRHALLDAGVPLDHGQVPLPGGRQHLDLGILAIRFGIELAGFAYHHRRTDLDRDAQRANVLAALDEDWRVLHATWNVLEGGFETFVEQVREVVAAQSRRHLGLPWPRPEHLRGGAA